MLGDGSGPPGAAWWRVQVGSGLGGAHLRRYIAEKDPTHAESLMDENWGATVARIKAAKDGPGAPKGNQNAVKGERNNIVNCDIDLEPKKDSSNRSNGNPVRIIARLKRDADPACPGRTQARHWLKRLEADLARRQADPASPEFVKPEGAKGIGKRGSNTTALSNKERHSKPGTLRRLARSHPGSSISPRGQHPDRQEQADSLLTTEGRGRPDSEGWGARVG